MVGSFGSFFPEIKQNNMVAQDAIIILPAPDEMELNSESDQIINMGLLPKHVIIIKSNNIFVILFLLFYLPLMITVDLKDETYGI